MRLLWGREGVRTVSSSPVRSGGMWQRLQGGGRGLRLWIALQRPVLRSANFDFCLQSSARGRTAHRGVAMARPASLQTPATSAAMPWLLVASPFPAVAATSHPSYPAPLRATAHHHFQPRNCLNVTAAAQKVCRQTHGTCALRVCSPPVFARPARNTCDLPEVCPGGTSSCPKDSRWHVIRTCRIHAELLPTRMSTPIRELAALFPRMGLPILAYVHWEAAKACATLAKWT